ncbi:MAG: peptidylprolyl isomerase [Candidatus Poribacteria bacterium]|nr:peptidylprolyl isomerase [Candidatus Poribacteria bacterium]
MAYRIVAYLMLCLLLISSSVSVSVARTFDRIIAYVNDDVVTKRELDVLVKQRAMELQQVYRYSEREALNESERQRPELLDRLIRQMLLLEAALTLKITVSDVDIEQYVQDFKKRYQIETDEEFEKQLNREGMTLFAFREQSERNLKAERLVMGRIVPRLQVRDSEIQKFFEENRDQLPTKSDKVGLRHIFVAFKPNQADRDAAFETVRKALDEIAADNTKFEELARRYAPKKNPSSQAGILIEATTEELNQFPEIFQNVLKDLAEGALSEPIEGNEGLYVFAVEQKTDEMIAFRYLIVPLVPSAEAMHEAREDIVEVYKKLENGEDFTALAAAHSDDVETRENGGDLGVRSLAELNPKTRAVIEALETGAYSQPHETESGLHIFRVDERNSPDLSEAEKRQITSILRQQRFQEEWDAYTDKLLENAYVKIQLKE